MKCFIIPYSFYNKSFKMVYRKIRSYQKNINTLLGISDQNLFKKVRIISWGGL